MQSVHGKHIGHDRTGICTKHTQTMEILLLLVERWQRFRIVFIAFFQFCLLRLVTRAFDETINPFRVSTFFSSSFETPLIYSYSYALEQQRAPPPSSSSSARMPRTQQQFLCKNKNHEILLSTFALFHRIDFTAHASEMHQNQTDQQNKMT